MHFEAQLKWNGSHVNITSSTGYIFGFTGSGSAAMVEKIKPKLFLWENRPRPKQSHGFYPRDAMLARVIEFATCLSVRLSVCPSVCPSVTRRYCVKTKKASGMISSPSGSPRLFRRQISSPNSKGFPPNGGLKQGSVGKIQRFLAVFDNNPSTNQQYSIFNREYLENGSRYGQSYY